MKVPPVRKEEMVEVRVGRVYLPTFVYVCWARRTRRIEWSGRILRMTTGRRRRARKKRRYDARASAESRSRNRSGSVLVPSRPSHVPGAAQSHYHRRSRRGNNARTRAADPSSDVNTSVGRVKVFFFFCCFFFPIVLWNAIGSVYRIHAK